MVVEMKSVVFPVASIHRNTALVSVWSTDRKKLGQHRLLHERFGRRKQLADAVALCASLSPCGNNVAIGFSTGHVDVYNMQSGKLRFSGLRFRFVF